MASGSNITPGGAIEVDTNFDRHSDDTGSGYGTATDESSTTSITSSIYGYTYENGRRYHRYREGRYVLPNDETEQDRLDMVHHMYLILTDGELIMAPIGDNPQRILDLGTGTGIWAIDTAVQYPSAEVIGTDLSPIQPSWVPPNCKFQVDDAESPWTFPKDHFDFVNCRTLGQSIKDWPLLISQMYKHTKPGGHIQLWESETFFHSDDGSYTDASPLKRWSDLANEGAKKMGMPATFIYKLKEWAVQAGFVDVEEIKIKLPWAPWPKDKKMKDLGRWGLLIVQTGLEAYGLALMTRVLGFSAEEGKKICSAAVEDLQSSKLHAYNYQYIIVARKPDEDEY